MRLCADEAARGCLRAEQPEKNAPPAISIQPQMTAISRTAAAAASAPEKNVRLIPSPRYFLKYATALR
jgi:hypothetical protein